MNTQELLKQRKQRGYAIAQTSSIAFHDGAWVVPSQSNPNQSYEVKMTIGGATCTCPDFAERGLLCKHIFAVEITLSKHVDKEGNTVITATKRIQYPQNWSAYNLSQITEKEMFAKLMADLCKEIDELLYVFGRPKLSMSDMVFASALKVYTTFSLRRFMTDMQTALEKGHVSQICSYSSVSNYMRDKKLTPILKQLIFLSAMPLKAVETKFAVDSSGFRTTKFNEYCRETHKTGQSHHWVKVHVCTGVKTNVITAVEVSFQNYSGDSPKFIPLTKQTYQNGFDMQEVSADKAYSSKNVRV